MKAGTVSSSGEVWPESLEPEDTRTLRDYLKEIIKRLDRIEMMVCK